MDPRHENFKVGDIVCDSNWGLVVIVSSKIVRDADWLTYTVYGNISRPESNLGETYISYIKHINDYQ